MGFKLLMATNQKTIPRMHTDDREVNQLQTNILSVLNPVLQNPLLNGALLESVSLGTGTNTVSHGLGRPLRGWIITRRSTAATTYDTQATNPTPELTLTLTSSGANVVSLYVF